MVCSYSKFRSLIWTGFDLPVLLQCVFEAPCFGGFFITWSLLKDQLCGAEVDF